MNVFIAVLFWLGGMFAGTFVCHSAHANSMMDRVELCNRIAMGAGARVQGFQGHTEWVSREQVKKYDAENYKGSMYIRDDGETQEERYKYDEPLMFGWKMEDDFIKQHAGQPKDPKSILDACMKGVES